MLKGLEAREVSIKEAATNKDFRIDAEFFQKLPPESPTYKWVEISDILKDAQYGISIEMNEEGMGFPIYRMNEIADMLCKEDIAKFANVTVADAAPFVLSDRDILFNRTNSQVFVGRTGLFKSFSSEPRIFASYLIRLRPQFDVVLPEYLVAFLNSDRGIRDVKRRARISINQSNVNAEEVKAVRLPLLSIEFQSEIKKCFDEAHKKLMTAKREYTEAEQTLLRKLGLEDWQPPEPLTYMRRASEAFAAGRLDSDYFAPRVAELLHFLDADGLTVRDVAPPRQEQFIAGETGEFDYLEISGVSGDGTVTGERLPRREAPSRATWHVRAGDVITSTVRPIRRLSAIITPEQDGFVCSSGFVVLRPTSVSPELLLTYLRLPLVCELMNLHTSASLYPAISERDLLRLPFPRVNKRTEAVVIRAIQSAHAARRQARELLERAKRAVEIAIEENEAAALRYLDQRPE